MINSIQKMNVYCESNFLQFFIFFSLLFFQNTTTIGQNIDCDFDKEINRYFEISHRPPIGLTNSEGNLFALLVGVADYNSPVLVGQLIHPEKEIDSLAQILARQGYKVKTLIGKSAVRDTVIKWLTCIQKKVNIHDRVLFYFAGHAKGLFELKGDLNQASRQKYWDKLKQLKNNRYSQDNLCLLLHQISKQYVSEFLEVEEVAHYLNNSDAKQKIIMIDACYSGAIDKIFHIPLDVYSHRILNDGFFMLTNAKRPVQDGLTTPIFFEALLGAADLCKNGGNCDGFVSIYETTIYLDHQLNKRKSGKKPEPHKSRYIFVGSGEIKLTKVNRE